MGDKFDVRVRLQFDRDPVPQGRHRHYGKRIVNPNKTEMEVMRTEARQQILYQYPQNLGPLFSRRAVSVKVWFLLRPPGSFFVNNDRRRLKPELEGALLVAAKKPDTDNLLKLLMDSLCGVVYHDDSQVCYVECHKFYDTTEPFLGKTVVVAETLRGELTPPPPIV